MDEENKIQDGEVVFEDEAQAETRKKKRRNDLYIELVLFFILGILIGITLKTEALKRITIGYNDYQMEAKIQDYDINKLEADLAKEGAEENASQEEENLEGSEEMENQNPASSDENQEQNQDTSESSANSQNNQE